MTDTETQDMTPMTESLEYQVDEKNINYRKKNIYISPFRMKNNIIAAFRKV